MGLFKNTKNEELLTYIDYVVNQKKTQLSIKYKAIEKAVDLLSRTLSMCSLETYIRKNKKIQEVKEDLFYKLNIKPNENEFAYNFWYKCWNKFFYEKEVLIISINHQLFIADDFRVNDNIIAKRMYYDITLRSQNDTILRLNKTYTADEVIHLKLENQKTIDFINQFYNDIGNLIFISNSYYKRNNTSKWILGIPGTQIPIKDAQTGKEITYEQYKQKLLGSLFSDEESITLLSKQFDLKQIENETKINSEDYRNLVKMWEESVADSFLIPRDIYFGNKTDKSSSEQDFFTYAIKPYLNLLENGLNSNVLSKERFLNGELIKANINSIKVHDIVENANSFDKLYSNGFSHNELRKFANLVQIDEPWANEHRITKNYSEDVSKKGGD